jgi:catechol 2,3-dioxygenase-like lactoylglutathione lyase family enzyme
VIDHVSLPVNSLPLSASFYDRTLATIGWRRAVERSGTIGYAPSGGLPPSFWLVHTPHRAATPGAGLHVSFGAERKEAVLAFLREALAAGGGDAGAPGDRPEYADNYYSCFVMDLDGFKIEATYRS